MRLNRKGMTLVELIISVALLSVVLGFLFKILLDVKYESDDAGFAIANQANRAEIIKEIQNDLIDYGGVQNIAVLEKKVFLIFLDNSVANDIRISNDNKTITYKTKSWTIKDDNYEFGTISLENINSCYAKLTIPILNYYDDDVLIDDIEIFAQYENCNLE